MIKELEKCCGCGACSDICPKKCITMEKSIDGFLYPCVNAVDCVECGLCDTVCPQQNCKEKLISSHGYIAFSKNPQQRENGSSGGIFGTAAAYVIDKGGAVFGAGFDDNLKLRQYCVNEKNELKRLYKSKYLQCDTEDFYRNVKELLESGRYVLVCNTPCNISALKNYLKKDYNNLLTIDFVCHGVPSQDFFDQCMEWYNTDRGMKILEYKFRKKTASAATPHLFEIKYEKNNKLYIKTDLYLKDPFYNAFQKRLSVRQSCYDCNYAMPQRISDITIGDFHDIDKVKKGYDRMMGVSMILVNSSKGMDMLDNIKELLDICETDIETLTANNECLKSPTSRPKNREEFFEHLKNKGVEYLTDNELNYRKDWKALVYYKMPERIRKILKKVILGGI